MKLAVHLGCLARTALAIGRHPSFLTNYGLRSCKEACSFLHTSAKQCGMDEFFDDPKNFGAEKIKTGSSWSKSLLRKKSIGDLHKLWFVLLKERNMLETLEHYCIEVDEPMPGPDRLEKVAESMSNLRDVVEERDKARNMLLFGRPTEVGGEWRKSPLGQTYWYTYKEHLIPKELQLVRKGDNPADLAYFHPRLQEMHLRLEETRVKRRDIFYWRLRRKYQHVRSANPQLPIRPPQWWLDRYKCKWKYGIHPRMSLFMKPPARDERFRFVHRPRFVPD